MGSTNKTTNYELSQFVGTDKPSWLSDYNGDMAKIDTAIKARSVEAGAAQTTADTANGKADALDTRMGTAENNITALQNASTTDHTQIATNTANISKNAQDIVQLDAKIGHTQITIGDHTVTGAIATLAGQGGVEADNVTYDNQTSGLTATNVQDAIDEVKADIPTIPATYDADNVVYNNTTSGLTATNVQDAIDELSVSAKNWTLVDTIAGPATSGGTIPSKTVTLPTGATEIMLLFLTEGGAVRASTTGFVSDTEIDCQYARILPDRSISDYAIVTYIKATNTLQLAWGAGSAIPNAVGKLYVK